MHKHRSPEPFTIDDIYAEYLHRYLMTEEELVAALNQAKK